jgi:hypothetical protein
MANQAHSSLLGIDEVPTMAEGRDNAALGPSDSSDSGSDIAGLDTQDEGDPGMPIDAALRPDSVHAISPAETFAPGAGSDAAGSGERRSAAGDAGVRDAGDISPDRIIHTENKVHDDEDPDLDFMDMPLEDEPSDQQA